MYTPMYTFHENHNAFHENCNAFHCEILGEGLSYQTKDQ